METIINSLNEFLSDLNVFYRKLQNYHWNIEGKTFFILHEKLEEYYNQVNDQIDEIAEHILIEEGQPLGTMKDYLTVSTIQEAQNQKVKEDEVYTNIIKDFNTLLSKSVEIKKQAEQQNDYATSSLMDEYILSYGKILWMLRQTTK